MINSIVDIFRTQACEHKTIQAFYYDRTYELGSGRENHPLLWLEDPITGENRKNLFVNTVNFSILFIPKDKSDVLNFQNLAFSIGLNIIERIKKHQSKYSIGILPDWTYITLRNYYDNDACGCRFSVNFNQTNMQNLCLIDEQFDEGGQFAHNDTLTHFDIDPANTCEVFTNKLPVFDLRTSK